MNKLKYCWKSVPTATVAILLTSLCDLTPLASARQAPASPGKAILQKAVAHAEWFNWAEAADEFEAAEKLLISEHDNRNALYAKIGILRATMEDHSLVEVGKELGQMAEKLEVQSDPELLLFASIAKADVDGELNALDARNEWIEIERLAKLQGNALWANRALGERSLSEFLLGNISKGRILIATALTTAKKTNDFGGQIRYLTAIGGALHYTHQN